MDGGSVGSARVEMPRARPDGRLVVGVVGFVLYCVYVQQAAALCCGNCLVFPNPGKGLLVSPSISNLRGEIFQIEGSLRVSFEDVLLWAGQQCQSGQQAGGGKIIGFALGDH